LRLVHISDTHAGFAAYRALDKESGINQREADNNNAFRQAIDKILELQPEVVLHTGDLFDTVRANNRTIAFVLEQLLRLSRSGIPVVIISGNHSTPRLKETGSIFQLFELFPNLYPVYKNQYQRLTFGDLTVHAVPHCFTKEDFKNSLDSIQLNKETKYNILMLHTAITGIKEFSMGEFNEQELSTSDLKPEFQYIALGHYHKYTQVTENACYAGSLERLSFNEIGQEKGFLEIDLARETLTFHPLEIRPMIDLPSIDAHQMTAAELNRAIEDCLKENIPEGVQPIIRLTINNISTSTYNALDFSRLRELTKSALHFETRFNRAEEPAQIEPLQGSIGGLLSEFRDYISTISFDDVSSPEQMREKIFSLGVEYLQRAGEAQE